MTDLCFVYGTLMRGFGNHRVLVEIGGKFRVKAISARSFPLVVTDLPYLLDRPGEGFRVEGEIYSIPEGGWARLDCFEGHPEFYRRRVEEFVFKDQILDAWVYFLVRKIPQLRAVDSVRRFGDAGDVSWMT